MRKFFSIIFAAAVVAAASSCVKDGFEEGGGTIRFGVSTVYENGPATKTEYSGKDQNNNNISSTSTAERINWLSTDKIRILCSQASVPNSTNKYADYQIVLQGSSTNLNHDANIEPADGNGLQWGTGTHNFFALYPAQTQNSTALIVADGTSKATVRGEIPAAQTATLSGRVFKPDMNYAYMYACAPDVAAGSNVQLDFQPLVTALEFTLLTRTGDAITSNLTSVKLSSTQTGSYYLAGTFTATLTTTGLTTPLNSIINGTNEITITLPDGGVQLSTTDAYTVTFLTLPMNQTNLTLTLNFADGTKRTLELKNNDEWITADACKKTYIWKLDAPLTVGSLFTEKNFTVSAEGQKVKFSPGNLQAVIRTAYSTTNARWQFADRQYSFPDRVNGDRYSADADKTVDLFMHPASATGTYAFGIPVSNLYNPPTNTFVDWGEDLNIYPNSSPTSTPYAKNTYRTLKQEEWDYLLNTRESDATVGNTIGTARYSLINLNVGGTRGTILGMLIYPDGFTWTSDMGSVPTYVNSQDVTTAVTYTLAQFAAMEAAGVVFLPAAGYCYYDGYFTNVGSIGYYWSASVYGSSSYLAYYSIFYSGTVSASYNETRGSGYSVRLVKDVDDFTVSAEGQKVKFSPGNLQAVIKTANSAQNAIWRFADEQYSFLATETGDPYTVNVDDVVDLFMHPESNTGNHAFGIPRSGSYSPASNYFEDWGNLPIIYENSSHTTAYPAGTWRTLTRDEWDYLLRERPRGAKVGNTENARYSLVKLDKAFVGRTVDLLGMLIYPDGFTWDAATMGSVPKVNSFTVTAVTYTLAQFAAMESEGVVFLPAAGFCGDSDTFSSVGTIGYYWSGTVHNSLKNYAHYLRFESGNVDADASYYRRSANAVRLVKNKN